MARWEEYQETGEAVNNAAMIHWLKSWGTDQEKICPVK
jgi:predicted transcriptional regulator